MDDALPAWALAGALAREVGVMTLFAPRLPRELALKALLTGAVGSASRLCQSSATAGLPLCAEAVLS